MWCSAFPPTVMVPALFSGLYKRRMTELLTQSHTAINSLNESCFKAWFSLSSVTMLFVIETGSLFKNEIKDAFDNYTQQVDRRF